LAPEEREPPGPSLALGNMREQAADDAFCADEDG
jgi:hypothetical protein